jgi:hypothetical protein
LSEPVSPPVSPDSVGIGVDVDALVGSGDGVGVRVAVGACVGSSVGVGVAVGAGPFDSLIVIDEPRLSALEPVALCSHTVPSA